jgi:hypothetical protein
VYLLTEPINSILWVDVTSVPEEPLWVVSFVADCGQMTADSLSLCASKRLSSTRVRSPILGNLPLTSHGDCTPGMAFEKTSSGVPTSPRRLDPPESNSFYRMRSNGRTSGNMTSL